MRVGDAGRRGRADRLGAMRRRADAAVDRVWAPTARWVARAERAPHRPDAEPRLALITVNFSTTTYLKLMLATLAEQRALALVKQVIVVDNASRDGGQPFLHALADRAARVDLVERRRFLSHAHGMRAGVAALRRREHDLPADERATHLLFVDTDVIWRSPDALLDLTSAAVATDAALAGEIRLHGPNPHPDIQASLFLLRRDVYDDPAIPPLLNCGSPAYRLQRAVIDRGDVVVDVPTNRNGLTLHRGRAGVTAAAAHPRHPYAHATKRDPSFMGVYGGGAIWAEAEATYAARLGADGEPALLDLLADRLGPHNPDTA